MILSSLPTSLETSNDNEYSRDASIRFSIVVPFSSFSILKAISCRNFAFDRTSTCSFVPTSCWPSGLGVAVWFSYVRSKSTLVRSLVWSFSFMASGASIAGLFKGVVYLYLALAEPPNSSFTFERISRFSRLCSRYFSLEPSRTLVAFGRFCLPKTSSSLVVMTFLG